MVNNLPVINPTAPACDPRVHSTETGRDIIQVSNYIVTQTSALFYLKTNKRGPMNLENSVISNLK